MADTIIDDPGPGAPQQPYPPPPPYGYPPQPYGAPGYGHGAPPPPRKRRVPIWAIVAGAVGGLALVALIVFFAVFYYKPVALRHVPPGTTAVVRLDLADVVLFAPVRRNLLPLVDEPPAGGPPPTTGGKSRSERVADAVGFSPTRDLREIVVCFLGSEDRIVLVVGGNIPKGKLVPGLLKVAAEEGNQDWVAAGDVMKAKFGGLTIGQADDGSAIVATDEQALRAAMPETGESQRLAIAENEAVSFAFSGQLWKDLSSGTYASMLESLQNLKQLDSGNGHLTLSNNPRMDTQILVAQGTSPEDAKATLYRVFTDLRRVSELKRKLTGAAQDLAGEEQALAQSSIETKGTLLHVVTPWPYDGLDRGAANLAQKIRTMKQSLGKPPQPAGTINVPGMGGIQLPIGIPGITQ